MKSIDNLVTKLNTQFEFLQTSNKSNFHDKLKRFWGFVSSQPPFAEIIDELWLKHQDSQEVASLFIRENMDNRFQKTIDCASHYEYLAISAFIVKQCTEKSIFIGSFIDLMLGYSHSGKPDDAINLFISEFVNPVKQYIEEKVSDSATILTFLIRYKHKAEWFKREKLYQLSNDNTKKGEQLLAQDLYEYLFDQGVEFNIESWSVSGEADIVASQSGNERFVADAKIFNPEKSKSISYLSQGFNQIYTYTNDYNQSFGYIVIYKTCEKDLEILLSGQTLTVPFVEYNNKIIYLLTIDIFPHEKSASKRGKLEKITITTEDLIK